MFKYLLLVRLQTWPLTFPKSVKILTLGMEFSRPVSIPVGEKEKPRLGLQVMQARAEPAGNSRAGSCLSRQKANKGQCGKK